MSKSRLTIENSTSLEFENPMLMELLTVWRQKRCGRELPARNDFDPLELPADVWPHLVLIDVEGLEKARFRYRLLGSHIVDTLGRNATGRYIDEVQDPLDYDVFVEGFRQAISLRQPIRSTGNAIFVNKAWVTYESVILPLSPDDDLVNMLLVPAVFTGTQEPDAP